MVLCLLWTAVAGASVSGQQLGVSNPRDILATDPGAFALLLQTTRPEPVSARDKARTLSTLPEKGEVTKLNASARRKLAALGPLLRATGRDSVYEIKVVDIPLARIGLHQRTVLLISETALSLVEADELQALVAHEIGHEYLRTDYDRASRLGDQSRLEEVELLCDAFAIVTLQGLGMNPSRLITGIERIMHYNEQLFGTAYNQSGYPTLFERREFARAVRAWVARGR